MKTKRAKIDWKERANWAAAIIEKRNTTIAAMDIEIGRLTKERDEQAAIREKLFNVGVTRQNMLGGKMLLINYACNVETLSQLKDFNGFTEYIGKIVAEKMSAAWFRRGE